MTDKVRETEIGLEVLQSRVETLEGVVILLTKAVMNSLGYASDDYSRQIDTLQAHCSI